MSSKYFLDPITPKKCPTMEERIKDAILDLEKRIDRIEERFEAAE